VITLVSAEALFLGVAQIGQPVLPAHAIHRASAAATLNQNGSKGTTAKLMAAVDHQNERPTDRSPWAKVPWLGA
jgi:hypothetical protein